MEGFKPVIETNKTETEDKEKLAEARLEELLDNPDNEFLLSVPRHMEVIESAATAQEALQYAQNRIHAREAATFTLRTVEQHEDVEYSNLDYTGIRHTLEIINQYAVEIGKGGDAIVVVSSVEGAGEQSYICYKFAKEEETPRGRNPMEVELELHAEFYEALTQVEDLAIGVPTPYYYITMARQKLLAMEKLPAASVSDILRHKASLPAWFDSEAIDYVCNELIRAVNILHDQGLYHRDLHSGNIMVSTNPQPENVDKLGYIIDFGLSAKGVEGMDPYRKDTASGTFTYNDDYGKIESVRTQLKALIERRSL